MVLAWAFLELDMVELGLAQRFGEDDGLQFHGEASEGREGRRLCGGFGLLRHCCSMCTLISWRRVCVVAVDCSIDERK